MIFDLQRASTWKRVSALLFDFIMMGILAVGCALFVSWAIDFDAQMDKRDALYTTYEEAYGIKINNLTQAEFDAMTKEQKDYYYEVEKIWVADKEVQDQFFLIFYMSLIIVTLGILLACVVWEFIIPWRLGNGQTVGKKLFGIAVMRTDGVRISTPILFARAILGKFTVETMLPVLILLMLMMSMIGPVGPIILLALLVMQFFCIFTTQTRSAIHDVVAHTVVVDMASQMIFESEEAMLDYKKRLAAERAAERSY